MDVESATYRSLLNACIDPDGPVHWLAPQYISVTGLDGGAIVLPLKSVGSLDPHLCVAIRLKLTPLRMVVLDPRAATAFQSGGSDAALIERR